jgi:hypothetical protein
MNSFIVLFNFEGETYTSEVLPIYPPGDMQWHIFLKGSTLIEQAGTEVLMVFSSEKNDGFTWGFPNGPKGHQIANAFGDQLRDYIIENRLFPYDK